MHPPYLTAANAIILERIVRTMGTVDLGLNIYGEHGLGKEALIRLIHTRSPHCKRPFFKVNCPQLITEDRRGRVISLTEPGFTGSHLFRRLFDGVLYLHAVDELDKVLQQNLLTLIRRRLRKTPHRERSNGTGGLLILSTATRSLEQCVAAGRFNAELYRWLSGLSIHVAPLHRCPERIAALVDSFIGRFSPSIRSGPPRRPCRTVMKKLCAHRWPGNVKQLQTVVETAVRLNDWQAALRISADGVGASRGGQAADLPSGCVVRVPEFGIRYGRLSGYLEEKLGEEEMGLMDLVMADAFMRRGDRS